MRIAVYGGDELRASVVALGFVPSGERAAVAIVDTADAAAIAAAAALPSAVPRLIVGSATHRELVAALGADRSRVVESIEPAIIGPALMSLLPAPSRMRTRVVLVTGVRGGVGRTLLVTNLARRLARHARVCVVDVTGSGAAAWWLGCEAAPWSTLEGLVEEMSADHLAVVAHDAAPDLRLVGGALVAPSLAIAAATIRAAAASHDIVVVDAPPVWDRVTASLRADADRRLVMSYEDAASVEVLGAAEVTEDEWVIASQSRARRIGEHAVFRALPRDEAAVAGALQRRAAVGDGLGRAYDDLAALLAIDAS